MKNLPWLQEKIDKWLSLILENRAPHAVLISGGKGLGKLQLAKEMTDIALCENLTSKGVCHNCSACHLLVAGNHTDFSMICAEKATIKVDQIRQLSRNVTLSSTRNQHKVILIKETELMNKAAANALLKTLEEPPSNVIIILTSNDIGQILPTIKSRCVKINFSSPPYQQACEWLQSQNQFERQDVDLSLMLCNGAPLMALEILNQEALPIFKQMLEDMRLLKTGTKSILEVSQMWLNNDWCIYLDLLAAYFLAILKNKKHLNVLLMDNILQSTDFKNNSDSGQLLIFVREIYIFKKRQKTALKSTLLLEELLINWKGSR